MYARTPPSRQCRLIPSFSGKPVWGLEGEAPILSGESPEALGLR
ncbi:hypothetical protein DB31_1321 [Hyalangium minutum]|uniref:Uncharacterized protein n=1 Tax=Hyalangium minutum TaxID=394096 RepID=A0A085WEZ3_9BACT|nr:hypothetical protein DB31_1321 [Hyalangium minutum]